MAAKTKSLNPDEILHSAQSEILRGDQYVHPVVVVDIDCLIDYPLTHLLARVSRDEFAVIYPRIAEYNESYLSDRFECLIGDVDIDAARCINNPPKKEVFDRYVQTKNTLFRIVDETLEISITAEDTVRVDIYTAGKYVPVEIQQLIYESFKVCTNTKVTFIDKDINFLNEETYADIGTLFVYDYEKLHASKNYEKVFGEAKLVMMRVFAHRIISQNIKDASQEEALANTFAFLNALFNNFEYLTMGLTNG